MGVERDCIRGQIPGQGDKWLKVIFLEDFFVCLYALCMSEYYNPQRVRNLYDPKSQAPFRLSRSKLDLFGDCPRCFYLDRRLGVGRPPGFPFNLNSAVDTLLKKEFDKYRKLAQPHPWMTQFGIDGIPFAHEKIEEWRDALRRGVQHPVPGTNLVITGGVDDVWVRASGALIVVDYKATSKDGEVSLDAPWQDGYKRQIEIYQWLFRKNEFTVDDTGVFVYCNGKKDAEEFLSRLHFDVKLISYVGKTDWVDALVAEAYACLQADQIPTAGEGCDYCAYIAAVGGVLAPRAQT